MNLEILCLMNTNIQYEDALIFSLANLLLWNKHLFVPTESAQLEHYNDNNDNELEDDDGPHPPSSSTPATPLRATKALKPTPTLPLRATRGLKLAPTLKLTHGARPSKVIRIFKPYSNTTFRFTTKKQHLLLQQTTTLVSLKSQPSPPTTL